MACAMDEKGWSEVSKSLFDVEKEKPEQVLVNRYGCLQ